MNSFGSKFRITIFGESHGFCIGICIDGVPPGINIEVDDFNNDILRRKPGHKGTSPRIEADTADIISGVYNGFSTGAAITILFHNSNINSRDYEKYCDIPRPGHADFTADIKYNGFNDFRGSGTFSGRMTLALVAAGVIAKKLISPIAIRSNILAIGNSKDLDKAISQAMEKRDSIGGIIQCKIENIKAGIGEPFFDSLESVISHLVFSIPGIKGIEFGNGFQAAKIYGSENNDVFIDSDGTTKTNNSGGINGGISNGNNIYFTVAVKPTPSIGIIQKTYNFASHKMDELEIQGRHDVCFALRVPVIIESVTAIALANLI